MSHSSTQTDPKFFTGTAIDYLSGVPHDYPAAEARIPEIHLDMDLILTKKDKWWYMWSHSAIDGILEEDAREKILASGEHYKIVDARTGEILKEE